MKLQSFLPLLAMGVAASTAPAAIIWSDDYATPRGVSPATAPNSYDYAGGAVGDDYTVVTGGNGISVGSGYGTIADTTSASTNLSVFANQFSSTNIPAGSQVTVSYDLRINSLTAAAGNSVPRFSIMSGNGTAGFETFTVGFGYAGFTGAPANTMGFYYGTTAGGGVSTGNGINIGGSGFEFGTYNGGTPADNGTNNTWYRISLTMVQGQTLVNGLITNLSSNETASFSGNSAFALNWTGSTGDGVRITTGAGGNSNLDFDNISVDVIPEPSSLLLGAVSLAVCFRRRR